MLQGKVVVVTGAGRGIGREIALLCARKGAAVVVNDLGTNAEGDGTDQGPAEEVVSEIVKSGGRAIVNGASIADPQGATSIITDAIKAFGRIDGVVNNAGILRDRIFHKMSDVDWREVLSVHLDRLFSGIEGRSASFQGTRIGRVRALHLDVGFDRQFRSGELCRRENGHCRAF